MYIQQFFIDGLGCASYLIGCEAQGVAAVIDPDRDVQKYLLAAQQHGLTISHIIETHLHADHVSGNTDLAARTGAQVSIHATAGVQYAHQPLNDGDVLPLGNVKITVKHTPGHTPESITLLVSDTTRSEEPWMALTGDLLFVGDVGRPDLVGAEAARGLADNLYDSLFNTILREDDGIIIYPGHGAGSLCGRAIGSVRSSTIGYERRFNPALAVTDRNAFIDHMTTNLPEQPGNHTRIKAMNRKGPKPLGDIVPHPLSIKESIPSFQQGAGMLDTRSKEEYVKLHVPGAVHLEADDQLSNKISFILPPEVPLVLVVNDEYTFRQVVMSLARVGYENVIGYLAEGIQGWEAMGLPVTSGDIVNISPSELDAMLNNGHHPVVIDVREPWEYQQGHIPGAQLIPLGSLAGKVDELDPEQPVAVVCASGNRSQSAAALLGQKGFTKVFNLVNGMYGWQQEGYQVTRN